MLDLLGIFEGSHWLSSKLSCSVSKKPLFFLNEKTVNVILMAQLLNKTNCSSTNWFGLNIISPNGLSSNAIDEINLFSSNKDASGTSISFNFMYYKYYNKVGNTFRIFQGSHGAFGISNSDIFFPASSFIEKDSLYLNS